MILFDNCCLWLDIKNRSNHFYSKGKSNCMIPGKRSDVDKPWVLFNTYGYKRQDKNHLLMHNKKMVV